MIKQSKTQSQKVIMFSKEISRLPSSLQTKNQIPIIQEDSLYPRVFPDRKVPLKVAIMRKIKAYQEFELNTALQNIDWKYGKGLLELMYYNFEIDTAIDECTEQRIQKKLIKGRAYDNQSNQFKEFIVQKIKERDQEYSLVGSFSQNPKRIVQIKKFYVCLSFQNPQLFSKMVLQALQTRNYFLSVARFNFYIDNMDLQQTPDLPKQVLNNITRLIGLQFLNREYYMEVNNHFKRTMNEILFTHTILNDETICLEAITGRQKRKINRYKPKNRTITLYKDGKKFKLTLKSLKTKIEQVESKTIFFKDEIVHLMHQIKGKLQMIYNYPIFDLKDEIFVIDRFIADNMLMTGYFLHFIDENIILYIAELIRKELIKYADGWFKIYELDKNTYLLSKLRRFFIFIEQNIKTIVKNHIQTEIVRYCQCFQKRLPIQMDFQSFSQFKLTYKHSKAHPFHYNPLIAISCNIGFNNFQMTIKKQKIQELLNKNLRSILKKLQFINTPQNKALIEIYSIFKDEYGIDIELPTSEVDDSKSLLNIKINNFQYSWIIDEYRQLREIFNKSVKTLKVIQDKLLQISIEINLKDIIHDQHHASITVQDIIEKILHYNTLYQKIGTYFPETGINFGLYFIDYKPAKDQLKQLIQKKIGIYRSLLIKQYQFASTSIERELQNLIEQIIKKPKNIYQLVKQRQKLQILQETVSNFNQTNQIHLFYLCQTNGCILSRGDMDRRWLNTQKITTAFTIRSNKTKEYNDIKKEIVDQITKQKEEIFEVLNLFKITLDSIKEISDRQLYNDNYSKLEHLNEKYLSVKGEIQDIRYKEQHLSLQPQNFQLFEKIQEDFTLLFTLWEVIYKWELNRSIWYFKQFREFQIDKPEILITELLSNLRKIEKAIKSNYSLELHHLIVEVKKQIEFLQDNHLRLLKLLKKDGFNRKHLQKIGIYIDVEISELTLQMAIDANFLDMIEEIEAVSNDAWNQFYLEQTLNRVQSQLVSMKYQIITYPDKKGNEIPLVNNYGSLDEKLQQIILDLQSMQFNPMKGQFQKRIQDLLQRSIYISKSLENCEIFQKKFVEVHPIFDSTDVVKQLPVENRLFTKVLRSWVELLKYFKKIVSVYDSCNGQNIAQKTAYLINSIENIKAGLANYLQKKRQGFSRFYLLTDQQLYELFASTNDMNILSKHISKLFHSIYDLVFDKEYITAIIGSNTNLSLRNPVLYSKRNLEQWLSQLQRSIKAQLNFHIEKLLGNKNKWGNMLNYQCSQILLMCYEVQKTQQIMEMNDFKKIEEKERNFIRKLVDIKKNSHLTIAQSVNLGSLLVLSLYFSEKVSFLRANNITDMQNFEIKKMMKICYKDEEIKIISFETEIGYGFEYLGLVKRLVLTNLTERMQLIYLSAIKYSLGGSAIGPAGTGKSQTTKDIARISGKNCIIYNCSQSLSIDLIIRILKGMAVTGLWICLDEFNRLHYQVLNMISEQLSIIFKYKAMGLKLNVQYDREVINFKPDFHLCITYNPGYVNRLDIPNNVQKQFRIVAMVNCDKKMICKLLFYSKGFKEADTLSEKLTTMFQYCQQIWYSFQLYDFGLRTLISVIELSSLLYKNEGTGDNEVNEAIRVLVFPRLSENHRQMLKAFSKKVFQKFDNFVTQNFVSTYVSQIHNILNVRLGIIMLGDIFSNKGTGMKKFQETYPEYRIEQIYINTLTIEQIYGQTNQTTRIFKDGFLTKKIREYIATSPPQKLVIYIKGVIFSEWIENLNSVLDNTRSLSLPSGEILWIPDKIKFIINCTHLEYASPATISRSCIISFKNKNIKELIRCSEDKETLKQRIYDRYQVISSEIKRHLLYQFDERLIIHWINKYLAKSKLSFTIEAFMHALCLIFEGMLDEAGKKMLSLTMKSYFQFEGEIFDNYWDGKTWKSLKKLNLLSSSKEISDAVHIGDIIIKNQKYRKLFYINKTFFINKGGLEDILLLIGNQNIGKSSITSSIYSQCDKKQIQFIKINLTRKIKNPEFHGIIEAMLNKKSNKRKGMLHGKELVILLDDLHLPEQTRYKYKNTIEFLTLLLNKKGCYNYNNLQFEYYEDLYLIGNSNQVKRQLNFSKEFLKCALPIFVKAYQQQEIIHIFQQLIHHSVGSQHAKIYIENSFKLAQLISKASSVSAKYLPKYFRFQFIHFRKIMTNILLWKLGESDISQDEVISDLFVYEAERIMLSRVSHEEMAKTLKQTIRTQFNVDNDAPVLFNGFQNTENGTSIDQNQFKRVTNFEEFMREIELICDEYVLSSDHPNNSYVVFPQFCIFICRISRGLSLKKGHASIVGLPKCGKKVLVQLCNYLIHGRIYRISDKYEQKSWFEIIKNSTKQSFLNKCPSILLLEHHQLKETIQKQELNTLLKTSFLPQVYSEADHEELTYLFQNQLIKTHQAINKENTVRLFINYLENNFHIILLMNPMLSDFKENIIYYPAISKQTEFYWIVEWPNQALYMIATQAIVDSEIEPYLSIFPQIHELCKRETQLKTKIPHWEGLYLDFLKIFEKLHNERRQYMQSKQNILTKSFNIIKETQQKLQATRDEIKKLQPAILILEKETIKTIKSLNIQKSNAESVNEQLIKKEAECFKVIGESNAVKMKLEFTNAKVEEELKKAWENVYLVKQNHIAEIKSLMNPSEFIKIVITAIVIILNEGDFEVIRNRSEDGLSYEQNYFETGKRYILSKDSKNITKMLTQYNKQKLTKQKVASVQQKCLNHPRWNIIQAKSANKAVFYFFLWVEAVVKYFKLFQETIPLREQLLKTTAIYEQKTKEVDIVKKELDIYQKKIKELSMTHKDKTLKLTDYTNQIKLFEKMLSRGYEILKEIETEKSKWVQYEEQIAQKFKQNIGNSILSSVLIIYASPHTNEMRTNLMSTLKELLIEKELPFNKNNVFWMMQHEEEIILKELGIYDDEYILNNLKIIQKTQKISFIIDPEEEGIKYMRDMYRIQGIMFVQKIDYKHKFFRKTLQKAIIQGSIVFVQINGLDLPYFIQFLINPQLKKNDSNGNMQILFDEKSLLYHPKFKLYLFTTNIKDQYSIGLISKVTTINFSMTPQQLEQNLISIILAIQYPQENEELEELNKVNIKDNIELRTIENKILNIFANMTNCEEILKTQDLLQILSTSNRLYNQIQKRIEDSNNKRTLLKGRRQHFQKKAQKASRLYFQIQKLSSLSPYYQYSFSWFINLFKQNLNNFTDILSIELSKGLPFDKKIIAPLIIAESQFLKIPFHKLFNEKTQENEFVQERYNLKVSKVRLAKMIQNIRQAEIDNLDRFVKDYPEKVQPILATQIDDIMNSIPDEFSSLEFFDKIVLINCFRPDCTIKLLKDWLDINLGTIYKFQPLKLLQNTSCQKPFLVFENSTSLTSSSNYIGKLFDSLYRETGKSVCYINSNHCNLDRMKMLLQSAFLNDQWVIMQGLGEQYQELNEVIINLMEEGDFKRKEIFRLWLIINQYELKNVRDKLTKMSNKIIFEEQIEIMKKMSSFFMVQSEKLAALSNGVELNKKKYILHELCLFHFMLAQKCKYNEKQWNKSVNFSLDDLEINIKYLYFTSPQELKKLYPNIITNIVYGGKITDQQDIETISMHIEQSMRNTVFDRNIFWQTVWADDKFPKSEQEYEMYLRTVFSKLNHPFKTIYEQYGINSFVINFIKQKEYKQITQFYNKSKEAQIKTDVLPLAKQKIMQIKRIIQRKLSVININLQAHKQNIFYNYLVDQQENYKKKMILLENQIKYYLQIEDVLSQKEKRWCIDVINNKIPSSWAVSTIRTLDSWINLFFEGFQILFKINYEDWNQREQIRDRSTKRVYSLEFSFHFSTLCQQIYALSNCSSDTHYLFWETQKLDLINVSFGVKVDRWYIWNAIFDEEVKPLRQGTIELNYYSILPRGNLGVMKKEDVKQLSKYCQILVYHNSFEYGDNPNPIARVYLPVQKNSDKDWTKRMRVHLTLTI